MSRGAAVMNGQGESFPLHPRSGDSPQLLPEFYFREGRIPDGGEKFWTVVSAPEAGRPSPVFKGESDPYKTVGFEGRWRAS